MKIHDKKMVKYKHRIVKERRKESFLEMLEFQWQKATERVVIPF